MLFCRRAHSSLLVLNKVDYPPRLPLAQRPTPLQFLPRASQRWGHGKRLWVKRDDLTGSTLTGNKVRKLEFIAAHAREHGYDTLITCGGVQSNHARATAGVCAQLGLHCALVLRGDGIEEGGNSLLDLLFGAEVSVYPEAVYRQLDDLLDQTDARQRAAGRNPLVIPTGGSNGLGIWGYIAAADELLSDLQQQDITQAAVICATGSGGTQAGLTLGMAIHDAPVSVVGMAVCDDAAWFDAKVRNDIYEAQQLYPQLPRPDYQVQTIDRYIGAGYGVASEDVYGLIAELASLEGLVLDPVYTGKAFQGLVTELGQGHFDDYDDIVFIHTGGIFGVFPHGAALGAAVDKQRNL